MDSQTFPGRGRGRSRTKGANISGRQPEWAWPVQDILGQASRTIPAQLGPSAIIGCWQTPWVLLLGEWDFDWNPGAAACSP